MKPPKFSMPDSTLLRLGIAFLVMTSCNVTEPPEPYGESYNTNTIAVINRDGTNLKILKQGNYCLYPKFVLGDQYVVFVNKKARIDSLVRFRPIAYETTVRMVSVDGTGEDSLYYADEVFDIPSVSLDGSRLVYVCVNAQTGMYDMVLTDLTTRASVVIFSKPSNDERYPTFSSDGSRIVYVEIDGEINSLVSVDLSGGDRRILTSTDTSTLSHPQPIPLKDRLYFLESPNVTNQYQYLKTVKLDASEEVLLAVRTWLGVDLPFASPNGERVAFYNDNNIVTVAFDGSTIDTLSSSPAFMRAFLFMDTSSILVRSSQYEILDIPLRTTNPLPTIITETFRFSANPIQYSRILDKFLGTSRDSSIYIVYP